MKKKLALILCVILGVMCAGRGVHLAVTATDVTEEVTEPAETENAETGPISDGESDLHTIYTRLWEYCNENRTELLGLVGDALIFVLAVFIKIKNDRKTKAITSDLAVVKSDASGTHSSQNSVIGAVNSMIDGYNSMRETYERYEGLEDDRNKLIGAVFVQNTAILEILTTVYANSKNMPQGVKDLVNLKYANCLKALESDESLRTVVDLVRQEIGAESLSENAEPTEDEGDTGEV